MDHDAVDDGKRRHHAFPVEGQVPRRWAGCPPVPQLTHHHRAGAVTPAFGVKWPTRSTTLGRAFRHVEVPGKRCPRRFHVATLHDVPCRLNHSSRSSSSGSSWLPTRDEPVGTPQEQEAHTAGVFLVLGGIHVPAQVVAGAEEKAEGAYHRPGRGRIRIVACRTRKHLSSHNQRCGNDVGDARPAARRAAGYLRTVDLPSRNTLEKSTAILSEEHTPEQQYPADDVIGLSAARPVDRAHDGRSDGGDCQCAMDEAQHTQGLPLDLKRERGRKGRKTQERVAKNVQGEGRRARNESHQLRGHTLR